MIEFGMIPEFVGRFPVIESTKGLEIKDLIDILIVPKYLLMKQYRVLLSKDNVKFHYTTFITEKILKLISPEVLTYLDTYMQNLIEEFLESSHGTNSLCCHLEMKMNNSLMHTALL